MKKVAGLLMLLLVVFLVSIPVVAESFGMSNEAALGLTFEETKIVPEEVIAFPGDVTAINAAPPSEMLELRPLEAVCFPTDAGIMLVTPDAGFEAGFYIIPMSFTAGGDRASSGFC